MPEEPIAPAGADPTLKDVGEWKDTETWKRVYEKVMRDFMDGVLVDDQDRAVDSRAEAVKIAEALARKAVQETKKIGVGYKA